MAKGLIYDDVTYLNYEFVKIYKAKDFWTDDKYLTCWDQCYKTFYP